MKKFVLTSDKFEGCVEYLFTDDGKFAGVNFGEAKLSEEQVNAILMNLPAEAKHINVVKGNSQTAKIVEVVESVTFDMFWNRYDDKKTSSRIKTEKAWNKTKPHERIAAYNYIPTYFQHIPPGTRKKYATTYLSDKLWNN